MDRLRKRVDEIKSRVRIEDVAAALGIELKQIGRVFRARCVNPAHDDSDPSFTIDPSKQRWRCYGCDMHGDVVDLVRLVKGIEFGEALAYLDLFGVNANVNGNQRATGGGVDPAQLLGEPSTLEVLAGLLAHYRETFSKRSEGREYLASRGFSDVGLLERLGVGYCDGSGKRLLAVETRQRLAPLGLFNEKGNESFYKCVTFPLTDREGRVVGFYGRGIDSKRHLYFAGPRRGVFNRTRPSGNESDSARSIVLAESVLDAVAWLEMGAPDATAIYGVHGLTPEVEAYLAELAPGVLYLALDSDPAGQEATARLVPRLAELGISNIRVVSYPDLVKDAAELLHKEGGRESALGLLEAAPPVGESPPASASTSELSSNLHKEGGRESALGLLEAAPPVGESSPASASTSELSSKTEEPKIRFADGELVYEHGGLVYRIGGLGGKGTSKKQTIFLHAGERTQADEFHLFQERDRSRFVQVVGEKLGIQPARVDADFEAIMNYLGAIRSSNGNGSGAASSAAKSRPAMSPAERAEAMRFLEDSALLDRIAADLETVGYVGDRRAKLLVYLVALSRRLRRPLSAILKSSTGAGKSSLMAAVVSLVPTDEVIDLARVTPGALYRFGKGELSHKLLVVDESEGLEEALYPLRSFQERGKLTLATPVKDPFTGALSTQMVEVEGPSAVLFGMTRARLEREDENRNLPITLEEGPEQTRRVQSYQASRYTLEGYDLDLRAAATTRLHHTAQKILETLRVLIPFQALLRFPDVRPEAARDSRRMLSLVEVVAYLFQRQREVVERDGFRYVVATPADYRVAFELAGHLIYASLDELAPQERRLYQVIRELAEKEGKAAGIAPEKYAFTRRDLREKTEFSQDYLKRYLRRLVELELVLVERKLGAGRHVYRLGSPEGAARLGHLTTPDELDKALESVGSVEKDARSAVVQ